ncbi:hypothetical protein C5167_043143 [Papaver somniferum]|uniref:Uncharacterized protein n=1 Tax=Papaver somniferum TaxID=3469 RepID=A0A4Y7L4U9_PAPSO|nr:hypothetical protein C5167_043143 [Papaver somniferum]
MRGHASHGNTRLGCRSINGCRSEKHDVAFLFFCRRNRSQEKSKPCNCDLLFNPGENHCVHTQSAVVIMACSTSVKEEVLLSMNATKAYIRLSIPEVHEIRGLLMLLHKMIMGVRKTHDSEWTALRTMYSGLVIEDSQLGLHDKLLCKDPQYRQTQWLDLMKVTSDNEERDYDLAIRPCPCFGEWRASLLAVFSSAPSVSIAYCSYKELDRILAEGSIGNCPAAFCNESVRLIVTFKRVIDVELSNSGGMMRDVSSKDNLLNLLRVRKITDARFYYEVSKEAAGRSSLKTEQLVGQLPIMNSWSPRPSWFSRRALMSRCLMIMGIHKIHHAGTHHQSYKPTKVPFFLVVQIRLFQLGIGNASQSGILTAGKRGSFPEDLGSCGVTMSGDCNQWNWYIELEFLVKACNCGSSEEDDAPMPHSDIIKAMLEHWFLAFWCCPMMAQQEHWPNKLTV